MLSLQKCSHRPPAAAALRQNSAPESSGCGGLRAIERCPKALRAARSQCSRAGSGRRPGGPGGCSEVWCSPMHAAVTLHAAVTRCTPLPHCTWPQQSIAARAARLPARAIAPGLRRQRHPRRKGARLCRTAGEGPATHKHAHGKVSYFQESVRCQAQPALACPSFEADSMT